ncbi:MAG: hypothetical protein GXP63_00955 [DPANN group archaeon]|nr:hypothetical protein [DPANN group archaeon]
MRTDISKTTILILLVFTVVVSVMGTYTVLLSMSAPQTVQQQGETAPQGNVELSIIPPAGSPVTEGQVSLNIIKGGE